MRACLLAALSVAIAAAPSVAAAQVLLPGQSLVGQFHAFTNRASWNQYAGAAMFQHICTNNLDALPDGTSEIPLGRPSGGDPATRRPECNTGLLIGATVQGGQIPSTNGFTLLLTDRAALGFGLDFGASAVGIGSLSFFRNGTLLGTVTRDLGVGGNQFLGALSWSLRFDRIDVAYQGAGGFTADNLSTTTPEPTTWLLLGSGLLALGGTAVTRRRRRID